jgi:hypothetical protein
MLATEAKVLGNDKGRPKSPNGRIWVSLVPYGLNQQHPNAYWEMLKTAWENRDHMGYAWRILRDGCCDGCNAQSM